MWIVKLRPFAFGLLAALAAIGFLAQAMARTTSPAIGARVQHSTCVCARPDLSSNSAGGLNHCQRKARDKAKVRRTITGNDFQPPVIEQVRLIEGEFRLQMSETSVKLPNHSNVVIQNLTRPEQPVLAVATVLDPVGRQLGRLAAFKNGGDPEDDPPTWPSAGDSVRIVVAGGAFVDSFGNNSAELILESITWPGDNGILLDQTPPRLEEICAEGGTVRLTFSEPVSAAAAASALQVDGGPATWVAQNQGYTLQVQLPAGPHQIQFVQETWQPGNLLVVPAVGGLDPVDDFVAQALAHGYRVAGREVTFKTPFGPRRADVVLHDPATGKFHGVEIKSTRREFDKFLPQQNAADQYINIFGASAVGKKASQNNINRIERMTKILWGVP